VLVLGAVLVTAALSIVLLLSAGEPAAGQTVRFQSPTEVGPDPFTKPADVHSAKRVAVGSGPYGGTGSDLVCDRELLITSLKERPDRLRAWARVRGIDPTPSAVTRYIRHLRPVTLTRDTRVTNHSFIGGNAVGFQAILQAGTAVLVDEAGKLVARCRCGNPLAEPVYIPEATCLFCPANYKPPPPCADPTACWRPHPDPPPVVVVAARVRPAPTGTATPTATTPPALSQTPTAAATRAQPPPTPASASFSPAVGGPGDTYTVSAQGFDPGITVQISLTRPDGVVEGYSFVTDSDGSGSYTFPNRTGDPVRGTYRAVLTGGGETAAATTTVQDTGGGAPPAETPTDVPTAVPTEVPTVAPTEVPTQTPDAGGLQCDPPRSQLEAEQCAALRQAAPGG
jgi:hypothetical protein